MGAEQEAAVPITWTEIFSGKTVTHEDIKYEQACILYNLGALHSMLGAMDKRVSEEGMKVSCTHFQCAAGAFTYLRDHFPHSYSVDMSHQILNLNINLMLGQAQECLLEKSMLDNRKSFLVARISAQVVDYYKEACRALENSETASLLGKIQKDWKKLVQMKIYYFAAVAHLHMGKQAEEQQKFGERVIYFQSALDKLNEAIKLAKGQPETVQEALRFTMDVIGGKYNSAKKDNDFIYHEAVPALDTLQSVKGAPLVKALPVNPTDPAVTGPDIFAKLVPMAAHEASSLYSEEKAKLLRDVMAKIEAKNEVLDQFMDSMQLDPETVDNLDMYSHIPPILMEKCAALSVRPDTVKNLVQSMQVLSGVFTDVEASLKEIRDLLEEDEAQERKLQELLGKGSVPQGSPPPPSSTGLAEVSKECSKYMEVHEKASFTNTELHKAMNLHIGNLRLLSGPLEQVRAALPSPTLSEDDKQVLQNLKRILGKVQEMRDQRMSLEQQLREMIQKDDITTSLVTTDRSEMKKLFEEQLKKYDQIKVYLEQNLAAQENILKALTDANVKYAAVRKALAEVEHKWNTTVQTLVASYEAYEDLMKKSQEGKDFYTDLEGKAAKLLEKARAACQAAEANRQQILEKEMKKHPPPSSHSPQTRPAEEAIGAGSRGAGGGRPPPAGLPGLGRPARGAAQPPPRRAGRTPGPPAARHAGRARPRPRRACRAAAPRPRPLCPQAGERTAAARPALRPAALPRPPRALRAAAGARCRPGALPPRLRSSGTAGAAPAALRPPGERAAPRLGPLLRPSALPGRFAAAGRGAARLRGAPPAPPALVPAARPRRGSRRLLRPGPSGAAPTRPRRTPGRGPDPRGRPRAEPGRPPGHHHRGQRAGAHLQLRRPAAAPRAGSAPRGGLRGPAAPGRPRRLLPPLRPAGAAAAVRPLGSVPSGAAPCRLRSPRGPPASPPGRPLPAAVPSRGGRSLPPPGPPAGLAALPAPGPPPAAPADPLRPAALPRPRRAAAPRAAPAAASALPAAPRAGPTAAPRAPPARGLPLVRHGGARTPRAERPNGSARARRPAARARRLGGSALPPQPRSVPPRRPRPRETPAAVPRPVSRPRPQPRPGPRGGAVPPRPLPGAVPAASRAAAAVGARRGAAQTPAVADPRAGRRRGRLPAPELLHRRPPVLQPREPTRRLQGGRGAAPLAAHQGGRQGGPEAQSGAADRERPLRETRARSAAAG
ncbi:tyrosine-protein phosphatase non-receptor type 23 isoform X2 [Gallus gallus]|nr:tyrosine-protein phosphatase non-receptor type 23 isoform X2 [Gallus gallus]